MQFFLLFSLSFSLITPFSSASAQHDVHNAIWRIPASGFNYISGSFSQRQIFDVSKFDDEPKKTTLRLDLSTKAEQKKVIDVPKAIEVKPVNKVTSTNSVKSFTSIADFSGSNSYSLANAWSKSGDMKLKLEKSFGKSKNSMRGAGKGAMGELGVTSSFETAGSTDSDYQATISYMQKQSATIVTAKVDVVIAEIMIGAPMLTEFTTSFVDELEALPTAPWDDLDDSERKSYMALFDNFGTHYVQQANLGGTFKYQVRSSKCFTDSLRKSERDFKSCASSKFGVSLGGAYNLVSGSVGYEQSDNSCEGLTAADNARSQWSSKKVEEIYRHTGGSTDVLTSPADNANCVDELCRRINRWVKAVESSPHSTPSKLADIPELLFELYNKFDQPSCEPCTQIKGRTNNVFNRARAKQIWQNSEKALDAYFLAALEAKIQMENKCSILCGPCKTKPEAGCVCPDGQNECDNTEDMGMMEITVDKVEAQFAGADDVSEAKLFVKIPGNEAQSTQLASVYEEYAVSAHVGFDSSSLPNVLKQGTADTITVEVQDYHNGMLAKKQQCIGSVEYPMSLLCPDNFHGWGSMLFSFLPGKGVMPLTGKCSNGAEPPKRGTVIIKGTVKYPNQCRMSSHCDNMNAYAANVAFYCIFGIITGFIVLVIVTFHMLKHKKCCAACHCLYRCFPCALQKK